MKNTLERAREDYNMGRIRTSMIKFGGVDITYKSMDWIVVSLACPKDRPYKSRRFVADAP